MAEFLAGLVKAFNAPVKKTVCIDCDTDTKDSKKEVSG